MDLLRFSTAGSVDDGKSTLIGRLLYDTKSIFEDQLDAVRRATRDPGAGEVDLSLLTDGLRAEREQGITIDVAYRYFATPRRKFIIADTPGHEQYTRNMATGASTADLAVVLVDARNGVLVQSRRHTFIAHLLGIPKFAVAVNKMDLVGYDRAVFEAIRSDFEEFAGRLGVKDVSFIPVSALKGDNVVARSDATPWYEGPSLLEHLETVEVPRADEGAPLRLPVQLVLRPNQDFRGFAGQIASGSVATGDPVTVLPSGKRSRVKRIHTLEGDRARAAAPLSVTLVLEDEIDISRGDLIAGAGQEPQLLREFDAELVWMDEETLCVGRPYLVKHTTRTVRSRVTRIAWQTDVNTLERHPAETLGLNDIGRVRLTTTQPLCTDPYATNRTTGGFVLVDVVSNRTVAAGMICGGQRGESPDALLPGGRVDRAAREAGHGHRAAALWFSGPLGAGKAELAEAVDARLFRLGAAAYYLDPARLAPDSSQVPDAVERAAAAARVLVDAGLLALCQLADPADRDRARNATGCDDFVEIRIDTPAELCAPHGLGLVQPDASIQVEPSAPSAAACRGVAASPDLALPLHRMSLDEAVDRVIALLARRGLTPGGSYLGGAGI